MASVPPDRPDGWQPPSWQAPPRWGENAPQVSWSPPPVDQPVRPISSGRRRLPVRPSPVFLGMLAIVAGAGTYLWTRGSTISTPMRVGIFVFVAVAWVISLCLHEFMHASAAWLGGDHTVEARGYLTLDPRRYMNRQLSIVLPIIFVLLGYIGLPGGAVMVSPQLIASRRNRSLVSAAGPLTNATLALVCAAPLEFHWVGHNHAAFASALAFLALLQVAVTIINSLPIPGLDGFGVVAPYLPDEMVRSLMPIANFVFLGLFVVLFAASGRFFSVCFSLMESIGVNRILAQDGQVLFTFWRHL